MIARLIRSYLADVGTWNHSTHQGQTAFVREMRGKSYCRDATIDAWVWFNAGWRNANQAALIDAASQINTPKNLAPSLVPGLDL